jgi:probable HAF family extracellular repeat protein
VAAALLLGLGACDASTPAAPTAGGPQFVRAANYRPIDLGSLAPAAGFLDFSSAADINAQGTVVGVSFIDPFASRAVRWHDGAVDNLGTLPGYTESEAASINDRGQIAGTAVAIQGLFTSVSRAVLWETDGRLRDLGVLGPGGSSSAAALNNKGWIVGWSTERADDEAAEIFAQRHAALWRDAELVKLVPGAYSSHAVDINNVGVIVGVMLNETPSAPPSELHGFLWNRGALTDLGALEGWDDVTSGAVALNARRQLVGEGHVADYASGVYEFRALLWERSGLTDLGTLGGGTAAFVSDINNVGQIVGQLNTSPPVSQVAFLYNRGVTTLLPELAPGYSNAAAINNAGVIAGSSRTTTGAVHAVLWPRQ